MEVILLQDVNKLGKKEDIVKVKGGYARNFLIPKKLAVSVTPEALKAVEEYQKQRKDEDMLDRHEYPRFSIRMPIE